MRKKRADWDLSPAERVECRAALSLIEGSGRTLLEVVRAGLAETGLAVESVTIADACDRYLRRLIQLNRRGQTIRWYEKQFRIVCREFGEAALDEMSRQAWRSWIDAAPVSHETRRAYLRAIHALYAYAMSCEPPLCTKNQVQALRVEAPNREHEVRVMSSDDVRKMLEAAGPYRHALAMMVFVGLRPYEVAGQDKEPLRWDDVDRAAQTIRISTAVSKTVKPRVIERPLDAVWAWLADAPARGRVCPARVQQAVTRAKRAIGWWSPDVLRHTAASTMLALWEDALSPVFSCHSFEGLRTMMPIVCGERGCLAVFASFCKKVLATVAYRRQPHGAMDQPKNKRTTQGIYLPDRLIKEAKKRAAKEHRTFSGYVRRLIQQDLDRLQGGKSR